MQKVARFLFVLALVSAGIWLSARSAGLTPETIARQQVVQQVLAPVNVNGSNQISPSGSGDLDIVRGMSAPPVVVDIRTVPPAPAEVDKMYEQYVSGKIDINRNEGPYSDAVFQEMVKESLAQGVDNTVQNYNAANDILGTLTPGASFKAIDYTQSQQGVPPDPDVMVGENHVVVAVNTSYAVYDKTGSVVIAPTLFETLWGNNCGEASSPVTNKTFFDPHVTYDESAQRYVLGIMMYDTSINGGDNGWLCYAVSQTNSAAGSWYLYNFDCNTGTGTDYFCDYAHIGTGQSALYVSANMFGAFFVRNHVLAFDKAAMYAGTSATFVKLNYSSSYFTLQPADIKGYTSGGWPTNSSEPHYFVEAGSGSGSQIRVHKWTGGLASPAITLAGTVSVNSWSVPVNQPQLGSTGLLTANDARILDAEYWAGKLWANHTVGCNPGGGTVNCIRWYEINISSGTPSVVQQGTFSSSSEYRSFPDLAVNSCGDMLVGYTKTSSSIYPGVYVAGREVADASGQLKSETTLHAGEDYYTAYDASPRRWGDYTGLTIDPDGRTFWYLGEYSRNQATARWSTWVGSFNWSDCTGTPTPTPPPGPTATPTNTPVPPTPTATPEPGSCTTYTSTDVPKTISTSGTPSVSSVLSVGSSGTINDVNVLNLNGTHTWINDLDFNLISPAGTAVQIMAQSCSSEDNFNLNLDDEAAPGAWPCPPTTGGTYQPSNSLSTFDGQNSAGTWTLRIDDNANLDGGSLNGWALEICTSGGGGPTPTPPPAGDTGWLSPASNAAQTGGDGNGFQTNPTNAYSDNATFAVDTNSGNSSSTSCTSSRKDKHNFYDYNITIPGGTSVAGIEIRLDGRVDSTSGSPKFCVDLSWNGGTSWTTAKSTTTLTTSEATYILGGSTDSWGHTWSSAELSNTTFRVRIISVASSTSRDFSLDWIAVRVHYQ